MEPRQKNVIRDNIVELIKNTRCNPTFLAYFRQNGILTDVDVEEIQAKVV